VYSKNTAIDFVCLIIYIYIYIYIYIVPACICVPCVLLLSMEVRKGFESPGTVCSIVGAEN
jgi:hypothetical protein